MFKNLKAITVGAAIVTAVTALSGSASAAVVEPKSVKFAINKTPGSGCPTRVSLRANIYTKTGGSVQVRFERKDGGVSAPQWVLAVPKGGKYKAQFKKIYTNVAGAHNFQARAIVSGLGKTKYSAWDELKVDC